MELVTATNMVIATNGLPLMAIRTILGVIPRNKLSLSLKLKKFIDSGTICYVPKEV